MGGRAATNIPQKPSPTSNHQKNVTFMDHQKMEPPNSTVPKVAETTPTVALTRALLSQGGGGGVGLCSNVRQFSITVLHILRQYEHMGLSFHVAAVFCRPSMMVCIRQCLTVLITVVTWGWRGGQGPKVAASLGGVRAARVWATSKLLGIWPKCGEGRLSKILLQCLSGVFELSAK